MTKPSCEMRGR